MRKCKVVTVVIFCFTLVIYGVFMVNVGFTKSNNKTIAKSIFAAVEEDNKNIKLSYNALYGEINILKDENNKLAIYLNLDPFDIRFGLGNKVIYVNKTILSSKK